MKTRKPTEVPSALKTINVKAILRKRGIYLQQRVNQEMKEAALPLAKQLIASRRKEVKIEAPRHSRFSNQEIESYWEKQVHIVEVMEAKFDNKLQQFIGKVIHGFLSHLESEIALTKSKDFFSDQEDDFLAMAQLDLTPLLNDIAVLAGQEAFKLVGSKDIYTPFELRKRIAENVSKFTQSMLDTDRETLINIVQNGIESGQSVAEIRGAIQADFENITKNQAQLITRTEVSRASSQAAIDAYEQSGVVEGKQWVTFGAVDECADYDGDVVSLSDSFYGSESEFKDGDPPLHPNCRCIVVPVLVGEKSYVPQQNKALAERIKELENQFDKRTKEFKELKEAKTDDELYIKQLEAHLGVEDD